MSRSTATCRNCRARLLHHKRDGSLEVLTANVARLVVDPNRHDGTKLILHCKCGQELHWTVGAWVTLRPTG
jgi:hypothetical protein